MKRCYNCGVDLNKSNRSKEHLPPKILTKYLVQKPRNNITIRSCKNCNNDKSDLDFKYIYGILVTLPPNQLDMSGLFNIVEKNDDIKRFHKSNEKIYPLCEKQISFFSDIAKGVYYFDNSEKVPLCDICNIEVEAIDFYEAMQLNSLEELNPVAFKSIHNKILEYKIIETIEQIRIMLKLCNSVIVFLGYRKNIRQIICKT
jgi:hypothetical protein